MTKLVDGSGINDDNYVPIEENKLKEEQQKELLEAVERYKRECLKSYSASRCGEVVKKFDFPTLQPLIEA